MYLWHMFISATLVSVKPALVQLSNGLRVIGQSKCSSLYAFTSALGFAFPNEIQAQSIKGQASCEGVSLSLLS